MIYHFAHNVLPFRLVTHSLILCPLLEMTKTMLCSVPPKDTCTHWPVEARYDDDKTTDGCWDALGLCITGVSPFDRVEEK